ncbi:tyrosine-type recombinase/integrase [Pleomorphochaeta sp. DL1XJH-081]|uniref:tyrosine-type recombinase/integrase n=1 Tax=Pleomorphochaeta sp. DL1XJH-081 TaxID=3409690 RepID=UPI003BB605F5
MRFREDFSLYKRTLKSGKVVWYYHAYDEDGNRISISTGHTKKSKARDYVLQLVKQDRLIPTSIKQATTLNQFSKPFWVWGECPYVMDKINRGGSYSRSFCDFNKKSMEKHILPTFGKKRITKLTVAMINTWLLDLPKKAKVSRSTANKMLSLLRIMLDEAVRQNIIKSNPATLVKPLLEKPNARDAFTKEEAIKLLNDPEHWGNELSYTASLLCACTGLRAGEIRALRVQDIHRDHITVEHSWDEKYGLKSTKSGNIRTVPITKELYSTLMKLAPDRTDGFVFSLNNGETPMSGRVFANSLYRKMREIGITEVDRIERGLSFHSWRHFFNTQLVVAGVSGEITRSVVGHESKEMTNHYLHLKTADMKSVMEVQRQLLA